MIRKMVVGRPGTTIPMRPTITHRVPSAINSHRVVLDWARSRSLWVRSWSPTSCCSTCFVMCIGSGLIFGVTGGLPDEWLLSEFPGRHKSLAA